MVRTSKSPHSNGMQSRFFISVIVCELAGIVGAFSVRTSLVTWYPALIKPSFTPPSTVFGPVWVTLYFLMGISVFLIWEVKRKQPKAAFGFWLFWVSLLFNALWSFAFFGLQSPLLGLIDIVILWILIVWNMIVFWRYSKWATYLLIPYISWVSFALALNASIFMLNP